MRGSILPLCAAICVSAAVMTDNAAAADKKPAPAAPDKQQTSTPIQAKDVPAIPEADLVAKVGRGGLTKKEYDWYLLRFANKSRKSVASLTPEERKKALEEGIDDEVLFQAAIAYGMLNDSYVRSMIASLNRSKETVEPIDPRKFTDEEMKAFYESHKSQFMEPGRNYAKGAKFNSKAEAADFSKKAKQAKDPKALTSWFELGWISEGKPTAGLPVETTDMVAKLKKGISDPVMDVIVKNIYYVFWVTDSEEPRQIPYEEAQGKVKFAMVNAKQKENNANLLKKMGADQKKMSEEDALFFAGLNKGLHRNITVRPYCINAYVMKKQTKKELLLPELKKQFPATILEGAK